MSDQEFRFQPLLNWAEQREEQQTLALAAATQAEAAAQAALDTLAAERERTLAAIDGGEGRLDPEERQAAVAYVEHLTQRIDEQQAVVDELRGRVDVARATLVETAQEKRSLERLRERDEATAAEAADRREAGVVDDLNMSRHARQARGGKGVA